MRKKEGKREREKRNRSKRQRRKREEKKSRERERERERGWIKRKGEKDGLRKNNREVRRDRRKMLKLLRKPS